ncbi:MAG: hypothetical protein ACLQIK_07975 [Mycobacterium sp.]|uniref:hypothetical protein n=1 Tax=Mycobacterium sp. TaxID=1785 RepID=UPI003F9B2D4E
MTPSRLENETAGNERDRAGTKRNETAAQKANCLIEARVRFPAVHWKALVRGLNALYAAITSRLRRIPYLAKSLDYKLKGGVAEMIRCTTLVCDAQDDLFFKRRTIMCNTVGVCKRIDLESLSDDLARLVNQLGEEVEGEVQGDDLRNIENKLAKIIKG